MPPFYLLSFKLLLQILGHLQTFSIGILKSNVRLTIMLRTEHLSSSPPLEARLKGRKIFPFKSRISNSIYALYSDSY